MGTLPVKIVIDYFLVGRVGAGLMLVLSRYTSRDVADERSMFHVAIVAADCSISFLRSFRFEHPLAFVSFP